MGAAAGAVIVSLPRKTSRLLVVACPLCDVELQIHVRGVDQTISGEEWLDSLPLEAWNYIHDEHVRVASTVVDGPRTTTQKLT